jgi:hypothetical protein
MRIPHISTAIHTQQENIEDFKKEYLRSTASR